MANRNVGKQVIDFLTKCTDAFHTVAHVENTLANFNFETLSETKEWSHLKRGGKYIVKRNSSSICMFCVGEKYQPGNGIKLLSAHTDSPCLKLKPVSRKSSEGFLQVGVQLYGGGIWHTWFDKDLALCGRVIVKNENKLEEKLVKIDRPLLKIPNICVHLDREYHKNFAPNLEKQAVPVIAAVEKHALLQDSKEENCDKSTCEGGTCPVVLQLLKKELELDSAKSILDFDLCLYDHQKPSLGGAYDEFIFSARQDNLVSCHVAMEAIIDSADSLKDEEKIRMAFLFDNEEVGSMSFQGADSRLVESILRRIVEHFNEDQNSRDEIFERTLADSFHISMDMAHYVHPNYAEKHEDNMRPKIGDGPVIKINCNQRYASSGRSQAILRAIADSTENGFSEVPVQKFAVRNDSPCGTTVGPMIASRLGIESVDIGVGCLSMHSIRETGYVDDVKHGIDLITKYFTNQVPKFD